MLLFLSRSGGGCFGGFVLGGCEIGIPIESMHLQIVISFVRSFVDSVVGKVTVGSLIEVTIDSVAVGTGFECWGLLLVGEMIGVLVGYPV